MSTRSTISILNLDGTINSIYAHFDGYLSGNGQILYQHYQDINKVRGLINLGNISSLKAEIEIPNGLKHNFNNRIENVTVFYGRDNGESGAQSKKYSSLENYITHANFQEYDYIFHEKRNKWYLLNIQNGKLKLLENLLKNDKNVSEIVKKMIESKKEVIKLEKILTKKLDRNNKFKL